MPKRSRIGENSPRKECSNSGARPKSPLRLQSNQEAPESGEKDTRHPSMSYLFDCQVSAFKMSFSSSRARNSHDHRVDAVLAKSCGSAVTRTSTRPVGSLLQCFSA